MSTNQIRSARPPMVGRISSVHSLLNDFNPEDDTHACHAHTTSTLNLNRAEPFISAPSTLSSSTTSPLSRDRHQLSKLSVAPHLPLPLPHKLPRPSTLQQQRHHHHHHHHSQQDQQHQHRQSHRTAGSSGSHFGHLYAHRPLTFQQPYVPQNPQSHSYSQHYQHPELGHGCAEWGRIRHSSTAVSSPRTPDLIRADSFDSQLSSSHNPASPMTPIAPDFNPASYQSAYPDPTVFENRDVFGSYPNIAGDVDLKHDLIQEHSLPDHLSEHISEHLSEHIPEQISDQEHLQAEPLTEQQAQYLQELQDIPQQLQDIAQQHHIQYEQAQPQEQQQQQLQSIQPQHPQQLSISPIQPSYDQNVQSYDQNPYNPPPPVINTAPNGAKSGGVPPITPIVTTTNTGNGISTTKRYPCRYKDSHQCEKTFTTSGHASRHSKIHTAEKAVNCTFAGCMKKFTRADNMKQHLETHFKERTRGTSKSTANKLTTPAGVKKNTGRVGSISRPDSRDNRAADQAAAIAALDPFAVQYPQELYYEKFSPQLSPHGDMAVDFAQFANVQQQPPQTQTADETQIQQGEGQLLDRTASDSCGLDALAAAAIQERPT